MCNYTGTQIKVLVILNGQQIGYGYSHMYYSKSKEIRRSIILFDNKGNELPDGFYDLVQTNEERLIIVNRTVQ